MERIILFFLIDPETNAIKMITFNPKGMLFEFWDKLKKDDAPIETRGVFSVTGVNEIAEYFKKTGSGKTLLPEEDVQKLLLELRRFGEFSAWEDPAKLGAAKRKFEEIEEKFEKSTVPA
jgi:hypothetical protein